MPYFPLYINIEEKDILIVGGGKVALRKCEKLLPFKPRIHIVAPDICDELAALSYKYRTASAENAYKINIYSRAFNKKDLNDKALCIAASDDNILNQHISRLCRDVSMPVNVVDCPELCTFFFPALINDGELSVGISTSGKSPVAARELKNLLSDALPENIGDIISYMGTVRPRIIELIPDMKKRSKALTKIYSKCLLKHGALDSVELDEILAAYIKKL